MLRLVSLMETYLCSVSSFIRKLNAADPQLRRICSLHNLNITQSMDTQQNQDDYKKERSVSVTLEKQNISEMFPPSLVLFQSYLFARAYVGLKDKPVNIVRILVLYRCISRPC